MNCYLCGCSRTIESKAKAEIVEGPKRGETEIVNLGHCKDCGGLVYAQREVPAIKTENGDKAAY